MESRQLKITNQVGRIDKVLSDYFNDLSRTRIAELIVEKHILVNSKATKANYKVAQGDLIEINVPESVVVDQLKPQAMDLDILYEDDDLIVVNKPAGMVVHPSVGHAESTLVNGLLAHAPLSTINGEFRPGIVHRIDKDTSGLLMVAKNDAAHQKLSADLKNKKNKRIYIALVHGLLQKDKGTIDAPIARDKKDRQKQAVDRDGKPAITHFKVLERFHTSLGDFSLLQVQLETGRTHQIRVHMKFIEHPIAGDPIYGPRKTLATENGQYLHAEQLGLTQPTSGAELLFKAELPRDFQRTLDNLRAHTLD